MQGGLPKRMNRGSIPADHGILRFWPQSLLYYMWNQNADGIVGVYRACLSCDPNPQPVDATLGLHQVEK